jgi:hypothetical protein
MSRAAAYAAAFHSSTIGFHLLPIFFEAMHRYVQCNRGQLNENTG